MKSSSLEHAHTRVEFYRLKYIILIKVPTAQVRETKPLNDILPFNYSIGAMRNTKLMKYIT
jgi:hypothetical protein